MSSDRLKSLDESVETNQELSRNRQENAESRSDASALKQNCIHGVRLPPLSSSASETDRETESFTTSGDPGNHQRGEDKNGDDVSPPELESEASIVSATVSGILEDVANGI